MTPSLPPTAIALLLAATLGGCIDSARPILTGAKPEFGSTLRLQGYGLRDGFAHDPEEATYVWSASHYAHAAGGMADIAGFALFLFEHGDFVAQSLPRERDGAIEYALLHKLTDGVFQVLPVDEDDADAASRPAHCRTAQQWSCRVETRDQLLALTRATAAKRRSNGGLAIVLAPER